MKEFIKSMLMVAVGFAGVAGLAWLGFHALDRWPQIVLPTYGVVFFLCLSIVVHNLRMAHRKNKGWDQ